MTTERFCTDFVSPLIVNGCILQAASHTKLTEAVLRARASISKGRCADQDDLHSFSSTRSSTGASSIAARRQNVKGGKEKPEQMSAALRYLTRQQEMAKQCADHMVLLDDAAQRLQKEERWHTETSAQHGASGIKHAVNICKIVEAMGTR